MSAAQPVEILLVEDSPDDAELTLRALRRRLANGVVHVRDGEEALSFLLAEGHAPPRLILLDLKMPKLGGLEVLARLRAEPRTRTVPVVVLTSSKEEPDVAAAYALGANSYIVKPVGFENFREAVSRIEFYWMLLNQPPR
ncbi:MAG: response regulator [Elusimicrobia bacterium]|nr:response regulator [Elusimicrobiota bacterium]